MKSHIDRHHSKELHVSATETPLSAPRYSSLLTDIKRGLLNGSLQLLAIRTKLIPSCHEVLQLKYTLRRGRGRQGRLLKHNKDNIKRSGATGLNFPPYKNKQRKEQNVEKRDGTASTYLTTTLSRRSTTGKKGVQVLLRAVMMQSTGTTM